jgi:hypothetical protein
VNDAPDTVLSRREVHLDAGSNVILTRIYNGSGEVTHEDIYTRYAGGYSVLVRHKFFEYEGRFGVTRVVHDTDEAGNVIRKRTYSSHFEVPGEEIPESLVGECFLTPGSRTNPLFKFYPLFTEFTSLYRFADLESRNSALKITEKGPFSDFETVFKYTYQNGYVTEMSPGGLLLYKRTYEYY